MADLKKRFEQAVAESKSLPEKPDSKAGFNMFERLGRIFF